MGRRVGLTPFPETSGGGGGAREGRRLGPDASPPLPRRIAARCPPGLEQQHHADLCLGCKPGPAAAGRGRLSAPPGKPAPAPGSERRAGSGGSLELGSAQRRLREAERARRGRGRGACVRSHRQREEGRREPWPGTASRPCRTTSSPTAASLSLSASAGARPAASSDQSSEVFGGRWVRLCVINTDLEKKWQPSQWWGLSPQIGFTMSQHLPLERSGTCPGPASPWLPLSCSWNLSSHPHLARWLILHPRSIRGSQSLGTALVPLHFAQS
nr:uridine-cytidine kinase 2 isoform X1 [Camelus dromedarius]